MVQVQQDVIPVYQTAWLACLLQASLAEKEQILLSITSMGHKGLASQPAPAATARAAASRKAATAAKHTDTQNDEQQRYQRCRRSAASQPAPEAAQEEQQQEEEEYHADVAAVSDGEQQQQLDYESEGEEQQEEEEIVLAPVKHVQFKPTPPSSQRHTAAAPANAAGRAAAAGRHGASVDARPGRAAPAAAAPARADRIPPESAFGVLEGKAGHAEPVRATKAMPNSAATK